MKNRRSNKIKLASVILSASLLLSACSFMESPDDTADTDLPDSTVQDVPEEDPTNSHQSDGKLTLCISSDRSFDPITGTDAHNMAVSSLMFESLFVLDSDFTPVNQLCESITTSDGKTFTVTVKDNIKMTDGSDLNAWDVEYTYSRARDSEKFMHQLSCIDYFGAEDERTLTLELSEENYSVASLLTVPIIKDGTGGDEVVGSGLFRLVSDSRGFRLTASAYHRDRLKLAINTIYLEEYKSSKVTEALGSGALDLLWDDPSSAEATLLRGNYEARYYNTTNLHFLGFNMKNIALKDARIRRAISYTVDREMIADTVSSGHALISPLIISPAASYYNAQWEPENGFSMHLFNTTLAEAGLIDSDSDGYIDYPGANKFYNPFSIRFLVNEENPKKVEAAQAIVRNLQTVGMNVVLTVLEWDDFILALEEGEFDIFYGETVITADFNMSDLLGGDLDYGGAGNDFTEKFITDFLSSYEGKAKDLEQAAEQKPAAVPSAPSTEDSTEEQEEEEKEPFEITKDSIYGAEKAEAARQLCQFVAQDNLIIPIMYEQYAVYAGRNTVTGLDPTITGVFSNSAEWKISN